MLHKLRIITHLCPIIMLYTLLGCSHTPPSWFFTPPSNSTMLYGIGSASDIRQAKQNAINDLLQGIQTRAESLTHIHHTQHNNALATTFHQHIRLHSASLPLEQLHITHHTYSNNTHYIQISIEKQHIISAILRDLNALLASTKLSSCITLKDMSKLDATLSQARPMAHILQALGQMPPSSYTALEALYTQNAPKPHVALHIITPSSPPFTPSFYAFLESTLRADIGEFMHITTITHSITPPMLATPLSTPILHLKIASAHTKRDIALRINATLHDCMGGVVWHSDIQETRLNARDALKRASIVLYKHLQALAR